MNQSPAQVADSLILGNGEPAPVQYEMDAMVYRSQVERFSLVAAFREASARVTQTEQDSATADLAARQFTFSFFAEARSEELVLFRERTEGIASRLEGNVRETYIEASRRIAQRFSFSLTISGAALQGWAGASEMAAAAKDPAAITDLVGLANEALSRSDEVLDQIFALLGNFFGDSSGDFGERMRKLWDGLARVGFLRSHAGREGNGAFRVEAGQVQIQLEFEFESVEIVQIRASQVQQSDPILFDLDGDGFELSNYRDGARFDIVGNGVNARTAFVRGGDAFLALDRNGNGVIDSGRELFGDQHGAANGFEELRKLDSNGDGLINAQDESFAKLLLFRDDGDGQTEAGELLSLMAVGIAEIPLGYKNADEVASGGNRLAQIASFRYADGRYGRVADAILNYTA